MKRTRLLLSLCLALLFLLHSLGVVRLAVIDSLEYVADDLRTQLLLTKSTSDNVVIVDIDEQSLVEFGQWPWPRSSVASLIEQLTEHYQVRVVGFDMVFSEREAMNINYLQQLEREGVLELFASPTSLTSLQLRDPLADAVANQPVVLGYVFKSDDLLTLNDLPSALSQFEPGIAAQLNLLKPLGFTANLSEIQAAAMHQGFFDNNLVDRDGKYRRAPLLQMYGNYLFPALSLAVLQVALRNDSEELTPLNIEFARYGENELRASYLQIGRYVVPLGAQASARVPFIGPQRSFPYVSARDVLTKTASAEQLDDKIVLIGTSAPGLKDLRATPVDNNMPGIEVHANLIDGILENRIPVQPNWSLAAEIIQLLLLSTIIILTLNFLSAGVSMLIAFAVLMLFIGINFYLWQQNVMLPLVTAVVLVFTLYLFNISWSLLIESRLKKTLTQRFGQYVPPELVARMAASGKKITTQGESKVLTVLFSDVRGFTSISENLAPEQLTRLMNRLLTPMTQVIQDYHGTIDKYMGDAIMAFWGAPLANDNHAQDAVLTAMAMVQKINRLSQQLAEEGLPELGMGIGINTGQMSVGNMGSEFRMAYTVMGDAVNLGSRLEALTRQYALDILVSEETKGACADIQFMEVDRVRVKGKQQPVTLFTPLGLKADISNAQEQMAADFEECLSLYRQQTWRDALKLLHALLAQRTEYSELFQMYIDRISALQSQERLANWDGVYTYTTK